MKKQFIPYFKLSKKQKRYFDLSKHRTWNGINPVTRKSANPREYNRAKQKNQKSAET